MRSRLSILALAAAAAAGAGLSGCVTESENGASVWRDDIRTPVQRQIRMDVAEATHIVRADRGGLAAGEPARLGAFLAAQGSPWSMDVRVQPLTAAGAAAIQQTELALIHHGVQPTRIVRAGAGVAAGEGDIAVTARRINAHATGCPDWRRANLMDLSELNSSNFGCATADNLARMVADPRELATGRPLAPASGAHAAGAAARYRNDQVKELIKREGGGGGGKGKGK